MNSFIRLFFFIPLLFASQYASGQNAEESSTGIKLSEISSLGGFIAFNQDATINDFQSLAPGSVLLQSDFSHFTGQTDAQYGGYGMFSVLAGFSFHDQKKGSYRVNPQLRLGFSYFSGTALRTELWKDVRSPWDTLISSQTGQAYPVDSVVSENYNMEYKTEQALLEASLIYRTNPQSRWCLYGGIGTAAGFSVSASTTIDYHKNSGVSMNGTAPGYEPYPVYYSSESVQQSEYFRNKNNVVLSLFIPLGVDFRIARHSDFWNKVHLFYEMRPGLLFTFVPEIPTISHGVFQTSFGAKVEIR